MGAFLQFLMRGPVQAIVVAMIATALPMMFWLGAAVVALISLRYGMSNGIRVFAFAMLPALLWWLKADDPGAAWVLMLTVVMSDVLRRTQSWNKALVVGTIWSFLLGVLIPSLMPGFVVDLVKMAEQFYSQFDPNVVKQLGDNFKPIITAVMVGSLASSYLGFSVLSLMIGRAWQAKLFNPGGFKQEFHELRLSPAIATALLLMMLVAPLYSLDMLMVSMVASVPLSLAGVALFHGVVAKRKMTRHWIVAFYITLIFFGLGLFLLLILFAVADSWLNLRQYIRPIDG
jgi:hypothetical protein